MRKIFPIDKTLNKIFNEAEEEFKDLGVSRDQIKDIFYLYWYNSRELMRSLKFPTIVIPKFGRFVPKLRKIKRKLRRSEGEEYKILTKTVLRLTNEKQKKKR